MNQFFHALQSEVDEFVKVGTLVIPMGLSPPQNVLDLLEKLREIMKTYSQSVVPEERREEDFKRVLEAYIEPLLESCAKTVETKIAKAKEYCQQQGNATIKLDEKESKDISDAHVFLINCYHAVSSSLATFTNFTSRQTEMISNEMDHTVHLLVEFETRVLLQNINFWDKIQLIKQLQQQQQQDQPATISGSNNLLDADTMKTVIHKFYSALFQMDAKQDFSLLERANKQCDRLQNLKLRKYAKNNIAKELVEAYTLLYRHVHAPQNNYANASEIAFHTPEKIQNLIDI